MHLEGKRGSEPWEQRCTYALFVEGTADELRVLRSEPAPCTGKGASPIDRIADLVPIVRVSKAGEFLGIEGVPAAAERVRKLLPKDMPPALVSSLTAEAGMTAMQRDFWLLLVQVWDGFEPQDGKVTTLTNKTKVPQLGGGDLDLHIEMRKTGPVACDGSATAKDCVEFRMVSRPDKAQIEKILGSAGLPIRAYDMSQEVRIVSDPKTLLPRKAVFWRWIEMAERKEGAAPQSEEGTRTYTFRWTLPEPK